MEYRYFTYGMFDGTDGNRYDICIPSPFVRNSKDKAMKDENFAYRFLTIDLAGPEQRQNAVEMLGRQECRRSLYLRKIQEKRRVYSTIETEQQEKICNR